ncbi:MAG: ABC transporter permease [Streptococcaceae bacterium]|jgi:ABC-2 type transport system permease protein|nr:ABC transporter permease [Streptococcaceae bacterium]
MKNTGIQIATHYKRIVFRNRRAFFFSLILPLVFYLLFTKVMNVGVPASYMKTWQLNYLVSMAVYSSLVSSVITVSNTLLEDQTQHFILFVRLTGSSRLRYYLTMLAVFLPQTILSIVVLGLTGTFVNQVSISLTLWLIFVLLLPILSVPFVLIGILISLSAQPTLVNILNQIVMFSMAIVGGLWWPIDLLPSWLQTIGKALPTYQISVIIQEVLGKQAIELSALLGLGIWTLLLTGFLVVSLRLMNLFERQTI